MSACRSNSCFSWRRPGWPGGWGESVFTDAHRALLLLEVLRIAAEVAACGGALVLVPLLVGGDARRVRGVATGAGAGAPNDKPAFVSAPLDVGFAPKLKPDAPIPVDAVPPNENVAGAGLATGAAADEPNAVAPPPKEKPFAVIPPLAAVFTVAAAAAGAAVADGFGFGVSQATHFADAATFLIEHAGHFHSPACSLPKSPKPDDGAALAEEAVDAKRSERLGHVEKGEVARDARGEPMLVDGTSAATPTSLDLT